jgi:hypothetical protein
VVRALESLAIGLVGFAACYTPPRPYCGFLCGPNGECPDDYACSASFVCRLTSAPASVTCGPDAAVIVDSPPPTDVLTEGDFTPPTVMTVSPTPGAVDVAKTTVVTVTFSEPVLNVSSGTFFIYASGFGLDASVTFSSMATTSYTLTPNNPLPGNTQIFVGLSNSIYDVAGNTLLTDSSGIATYSFTTEP